MDTQIFNGPPLPKRVRAAFAYLEYVQSRIQPCCHPSGELTKQELATDTIALRTLAEYLTSEQDFADPPNTPDPDPSPPEPRSTDATQTPQADPSA